jgi:hypothetical protein
LKHHHLSSFQKKRISAVFTNSGDKASKVDISFGRSQLV